MKKEEKIKKVNKKNKNQKNNNIIRSASFNLIELVVVIIITAVIVALTSGIIVYKNYDKIEKDFGTNNIYSESLNELIKTYKNIVNSYVNKVDEKALSNEAIKAMYNYLDDPYTDYLDIDASADLLDRLKGEYKGIGVEINRLEGEYVTIRNIFENSPASKAGLKVGDSILKINGTDVTESTASEVSSMIKNSDLKTITIEILRNDETLTIDIEIDTIEIPVITTENFDGVGYIKIETFSTPSYSQFKKALEKLESEGISSLVIDVRGNTGGYLSSASKIADLFLEKGKIIYKLEYKDKKTETHRAENNTARTIPVVVLVNSGSASASEVLAAALKESYGAKLVGTNTYGKGAIQETEKLSNGALTKITTAHWLTPKGTNIEGIGIKPDIEVELDIIEEYSYELDNQLQKAIRELQK